jgi:hypothetical protein
MAGQEVGPSPLGLGVRDLSLRQEVSPQALQDHQLGRGALALGFGREGSFESDDGVTVSRMRSVIELSLG